MSPVKKAHENMLITIRIIIMIIIEIMKSTTTTNNNIDYIMII